MHIIELIIYFRYMERRIYIHTFCFHAIFEPILGAIFFRGALGRGGANSCARQTIKRGVKSGVACGAWGSW